MVPLFMSLVPLFVFLVPLFVFWYPYSCFWYCIRVSARAATLSAFSQPRAANVQALRAPLHSAVSTRPDPPLCAPMHACARPRPPARVSERASECAYNLGRGEPAEEDRRGGGRVEHFGEQVEVERCDGHVPVWDRSQSALSHSRPSRARTRVRAPAALVVSCHL